MEDRRLLATIDLAALTAAQGTTIFGAEANDQSGISVSSAGDVNGDGFDDMIVGAPSADDVGNAKPGAGESYLIFGGTSLQTSIDLANLGTAGITLFGADTGDKSGGSVSRAGDVNGDGYADFIIGASSADSLNNGAADAGDSYVIFGGAALPSTIDLFNLGSAGITILGVNAGDNSGNFVNSAGDVNGDGYSDLLIGAVNADGLGNTKVNAGETYVVFGSSSPQSLINLGIAGAANVTIFGADAGDLSASSVSSAGDVNGDGYDDILIGAHLGASLGNARAIAGESYLIFGGATLSTSIELLSLGAAGVTIYGADAGDKSGIAVSGAGDVNGDGFDDILVGAWNADGLSNGKPDSGDSYVIFGNAAMPTTIDLAVLGNAGVTIFGVDTGDNNGFSVRGAGDVNSDGFDDIIMGAHNGDSLANLKTNSGDSYVLFGGLSLPTTIALANLGSAGITLFGADAFDASGFSVSGAGDVNGDGFDDLLIGAFLADASGNAKSASGDSYVIFGGDFTAAITHQGTADGETLTGTVGANVMIGGRGNDTLVGSGGADVLTGGQGNDILAVSDLTFKRIVGGTGSDTLRLDGSGLSLNLTTLRDNRILGIEQIDLTGTGNNTLTLTQREVLNISDESNTLIVWRNMGDVVDIGSGWTQVATETIGVGVFNVYIQGAAILKIQDTIAPVATSFTRKTPSSSLTNADTLVFLATFSEPVTGVDATDFAVTGTTGIISVAEVTASTFDVTITGGDLASLNGTVGLNLATSPTITDLASNALPNTEPTTDETYLLDNVPPTVTTASFVASGVLSAGATSLTVTFSEPIIGASLATNYELRRAGADGLLGNADDVLSTINSATVVGNVATLGFAALAEDVYRLSVRDTITDTASNSLDGDANGTAGGNWVRDFVVGAHTHTLTSPNGFTFDPEFGGFGAGQLVQGTGKAFDGLNRLQVGGVDYSPSVPRASNIETQSLLMSGSGWTSIPNGAMYAVPGLSTTVVSDGASTPIQVQASFYGQSNNVNGYVQAFIFVDGVWNNRSISSYYTANSGSPVFALDVADTLILAPGSHTISIRLFSAGSINQIYAQYTYANFTKLNSNPIVAPTSETQSLLMSGSGWTSIPNGAMYAVPGLSTTVVSDGASTPIQVQASFYGQSNNVNGYVQALIFVDGVWNNRSISSYYTANSGSPVFALDVADTLILAPGSHTISIRLFSAGSINQIYAQYTYANFTKLNSNPIVAPTSETQSLLMSGSGWTSIPNGAMYAVPGLSTTVVSDGASTPIQVQASFYGQSNNVNGYVQAFVFVDGVWNNRSISSYYTANSGSPVFALDVADTLILARVLTRFRFVFSLPEASIRSTHSTHTPTSPNILSVLRPLSPIPIALYSRLHRPYPA